VRRHGDSSVICPAEQTCVIDEAIYDAVNDDGKMALGALGQSCTNLAALAGFEADPAHTASWSPSTAASAIPPPCTD
jgi:hypothetical protein